MRDLAAALQQRGTHVDVFAAACRSRMKLDAAGIGTLFDAPTQYRTAPGLWLGGISVAPGLDRVLADAMQQCEVVHSHSLWMRPTHQATRAAKNAGRPVVLTAHGALEPYSLTRSRWKKRLIRAAFQDRDFRDTDCIHVNSRREGEKVRAAGFTHPLAVIPNGIAMPAGDAENPQPFFDAYPTLRGRRLMLFMARLHEKKGLGHFLPAWANVARENPDWHLVVAGPDRGFEAAARQLADIPELAGRVTFTGPLHGELKDAARAAAELFVCPSFSEGFSMSVLESLATGTPALITPGCNFAEAADAGAAVEYPADIDGMTAALRHLLALHEDDLADMGNRGRTLVADDYTWDRIAEQTQTLYRWLIEGQPAEATPSFMVRGTP